MSGYFDFNATTPLSEPAREAWLEAARRNWHNPSSLYREAGEAARRLEDARVELAEMLGEDVDPNRVVFNSGATEANNALLAYVAGARPGRVLVGAIEHPCVTDPARALLGERFVELPVDAQGVVQPETLTRAIASAGKVALVSVMAANNECGVLQPWRAIRSACAANGVWYHCDAAQWLGKLPAHGLGDCDFLTGSAHKFGGPKGVGFLVVPEDADDFHSLLGGPQQERRRAGTENLPGVMAMLAALRALEPRLTDVGARVLADRRLFENRLRERLPGTRILATDAERLWNTVMFVLPEHSNLKWLTRLSRRGFCVSTGSACSAGRDHPSRVLLALGESYEAMGRVLRVSAGWETRSEDWDGLLTALETIAGELGSTTNVRTKS